MDLGRLKKIDLREAWNSEASDFTPWLAREGNLNLLGDTIGIDLELEAQEKNVGPFRADILCRDTTADGHWVLIENQLERTDHTHLGQLITYAAGLKAVTIVWIAKRFTDEHRAAIDWLNEVTGDGLNFFGLEVELWKIADSPVAPKFNMVSKPNDWTKSVTGPTAPGELTKTKNMQLEFWTGLREHLMESGSFMKSQKPFPQHWTIFAIGHSHFHLGATVNTRDNRIGCELIMTGPDAKAHFHLLQDQKQEVEKELGVPLDWRELRGKKTSGVYLYKNGIDVTRIDRWHEYYIWFQEWLEKFHETFRSRLKALDAAEYYHEEGKNHIEPVEDE